MERKTIIIDNEETNYEISSDGKVFNKKTGRELKGRQMLKGLEKDIIGYLTVKI